MSNPSASDVNRPTPPTSSSSTPQPPHHSLPSRPPPSIAGPFKPASTSGANQGSTTSYSQPPTYNASSSAYSAFKPRPVSHTNNHEWRPHPPSGSASHASQTAYPMTYNQPTQYSSSHQPQNHHQYYQPYTQGQPTPPQIQNPFPVPNQPQQQGYSQGGRGEASASSYDLEMEAQIAQWQSAYTSAGEIAAPSKGGRGVGPESAGGANAVALGSRPHAAAATAPLANNEGVSAGKPDSSVAAAATGPDGKQKTVVRSGGGQTWQDQSLLEWDPAHFRLFVGNLAGEVTDDSLLKAFSKYDSVQKARVVRDKRTTKSKGYGFVSFSNGDQYFQAAKEMQGKYIGSHPVLLRRSTTEIKPTVVQDKHKKHNKGNKNSNSNGSGSGGNVGAHTGAGVSKKQAKTKGGLKILG